MFDFDELEGVDPAVSADEQPPGEDDAAGGSSMFDFDDLGEAPPPQKPPSAATAPPRTKATAARPAPKVKDAFQDRVVELRERYPHIELDLPHDARTWSTQELENFFESGGFIKPVRPTPRSNGGAAHPKPAAKPKVQGNFPQLSVPEASRLQEELRSGFADKQFQESLRKLQAKHPERKSRGHPDGPAFFESFERLTMTVYSKVLPRAGIQGDFDGLRELAGRMQTAMFQVKVKKAQEEINLLIGLPRDAVFQPASKKEELLAYQPGGDGDVPGYAVPLSMDLEGDDGHEFLIEDAASGVLRRSGPAAGAGRLTIARGTQRRVPVR